jgi:hypothetical protein
MDRRHFLALRGDWLVTPENAKRLSRQELFPLGPRAGHLEPGCSVLVKYRDSKGGIAVNAGAEVSLYKEEYYLRCRELANAVPNLCASGAFILVFMEGTGKSARCVLTPIQAALFREIEAADPALRLDAYDLPPATVILIDSFHLIDTFLRALAERDPELFAVHSQRFLEAPSILVPLFEHVLRLSSQDHLAFAVQLKKLADILRQLLSEVSTTVKIHGIARDHLGTWAEMEGKKIAFLDGGVARIAGLPGSEPMALRIGIYTVTPGVVDPTRRESWQLWPFVVSDIVEPPAGQRRDAEDHTDRRRLLEASRYVLEALSALRYLEQSPDAYALLMHGPLINQFVMYDEGPPHFVPCLSPTFLKPFGITEAAVKGSITEIPSTYGPVLWNQFMAIYGYVVGKLHAAPRPAVGVVERTAGGWLAEAVLRELVKNSSITQLVADKLRELLARYEISDDFLFGCVLKEGEYLTPLRINKNSPRRARESWQGVVRQYPRPFATILKTSDGNFPFRLELNAAATEELTLEGVIRLIYHTSRLLPRYAFPVGLDIADKFAKIPDWLSKGISSRVSADVLRHALRTGDPEIVSQVRRFLARTPRDFFYRPGI